MSVSKTTLSSPRRGPASSPSTPVKKVSIPVAPLIASVAAPSEVHFLRQKKGEKIHPAQKNPHAGHQWATGLIPHQFVQCRSPLQIPATPRKVSHTIHACKKIHAPYFPPLPPCWITEELAAYLDSSSRICCVYSPSQNRAPAFLYYRTIEKLCAESA